MSNVIKGVKGFTKIPLEERFWAKVQKASADECWIWNGAHHMLGYGQIWTNGRHRPAHQVAWELEHGKPFPDGMFACHKCDNPPCVNPNHIWPGTNSENIKDAIEKGRFNPRPPTKPLKLACDNGHAFTERNKRGDQFCRICRDAAQRKISWKSEQKRTLARRATRAILNPHNKRKPQKKIEGTSSQYKGVSWVKRRNKWQATIWVNGKYKALGCFVNELEAANAYAEALAALDAKLGGAE